MDPSTREDLNGFPDLSRHPYELSDLPPKASLPEIIQHYGTAVNIWHYLWPRVVDALKWLYEAFTRAEARREADRDDLIGEVRGLRADLIGRGVARRKLPSLTDINPEITHNGSVKLAPEAFEAIQQKVADLSERAERADMAEALAKAEQKGAENALAHQSAALAVKSKEFDKLLSRTKLIIGILVALGTIFAGLVHFLHL